MNTILNLGLNDKTVEGLAKRSGNPRFAYDSYRRFIQMFGEVALNIDMEKFDHIFDARKHKAKVKLDTDLTAEDLQAIIADYKKLVQKETKKPFPQDAREQLAMSRDAVFRSWWNPKAAYYRKMEKIPDEIGTARQRPGDGVRQHGRHVGHRRRLHARSRHRREGVLRRVPGQRAGRGRGGRHPHAAADLRTRKGHAGGLSRSLREITASLEKHYRDMQDFEFTIEEGKLYMLQTRNGKRTGPAAVRVAVEMVEEGLIDKKEAVLRVQPQQLDQLLHPVFDAPSLKKLTHDRDGNRGVARAPPSDAPPSPPKTPSRWAAAVR